MDKIYCTYHPTVPAAWHCDACDAHYCAECIVCRDVGGGTGRKGTVLYLCPKCSCPSERLAVQNLVEPFWNRLPRFFAYPLKPAPAAFILPLSLLMALFSVPGLLSVVIQAALLCVLLKYCFAVLKNTAMGNMAPPGINEGTITGDMGVVAKYWALCFLYVLAGGACFFLSMGLGRSVAPLAGIVLFSLLLLGLLLALPASIIVLAANGRLLDAVNPSLFLRLAYRIGASYFLMHFFLVILYAAPGAVEYAVQPYLPELAFAFVVSLAGCYYAVVAHHLMGYVILQHHGDIGYDVTVASGETGLISGHAPVRDAKHGLMSRVNALVREGRHGEAASLIKEETGGSIDDLELAAHYHNLLQVSRSVPEMLEHAGRYLALLVRAGKEQAYREVYLQCAAASPGFALPAPVLFRVAGSLSKNGCAREALTAYSSFIRAFPDDPAAPKAYLAAAAILHEEMSSPERAAKTLRKLIRSYPGHEMIPYAQDCLDRLEGKG